MRCGPLNFWQEIRNVPDPRSCYECRCLILKLKNLYLNFKINLQWTLHLWETLFWLGLRRQSRGTQFPEAFSYGPKHHFFSLSCRKQVLGNRFKKNFFSEILLVWSWIDRQAFNNFGSRLYRLDVNGSHAISCSNWKY